MEDTSARNSCILDIIVTRHDDDSVYYKLIECLQKCRQSHVAALLIHVGEEMQILNEGKHHLYRKQLCSLRLYSDIK